MARPKKDDPPPEPPNPHRYVEIDNRARERGLRLGAKGEEWVLYPVGVDKYDVTPAIASRRLKDLQEWLLI